MNKNFYTALLLALFATAKVSASTALITTDQLKEYENAMVYLSCVYSGSSNCPQTYGKTQDARDILDKYKDVPAGGLNATKKSALDQNLPGLLSKLSVEEVEEYSRGLMDLTDSTFLEELRDDVVITTTLTMPNVQAMESAAEQDFSMVSMYTDQEVQTYVATKQDLEAKIAANAAEPNKKVVKDAYLQGAPLDKEAGLNTNFSVIDANTVGVIDTDKLTMSTAIGLEKKFSSKFKVKRYAEENYAIKIFEYGVKFETEIDEEVYNQNEERQYTPKLDFEMTNNEFDESWANRYEDVKSQDRIERNIYNKKQVLKFAAEAVLTKYDDSYERYRGYMVYKTYENSPSEAADLHETLLGYYNEIGHDKFGYPGFVEKMEKKEKDSISKVDGYFEQGDKFISEVSAFNDQESRDIINLYNKVKTLDYYSLRDKRFQEELRANRAVVGFRVYVD